MADLGIASLLTAFAAGTLSVLSPCVMPLMPAYLSLVSGMSLEEMREGGGPERRSRRPVLIGAGAFILGFSCVFVLLGASASAIGPWLRTWNLEIAGFRVGVAQLAGALIFAMGLHVAGWLRIPWLDREKRFDVAAVASPAGAALVGAAFAFGWTPCIGPILGGILTLAGSRETVGEGVLLLATYSAGLGVPFLAAAFSLEAFLRAFGSLRRHFHKLELFAGGVLILVGFLVFTNQLTRLYGYFAFLERWVVALEEALL